MSECVVRMDHIPRNCLECPLNGQCGIFADWVCTLNLPARKHYPQPFDKGCNILAVLPEPHGRLGDLDALLKFMFEYDDYQGAKEAHDLDLIHRDSICYLIEEAPTIVPAEAERSET